MLVGLGLSAISILPMFLFNDDKTLGIDSEAYQELMALEGSAALYDVLATLVCCRSPSMGCLDAEWMQLRACRNPQIALHVSPSAVKKFQQQKLSGSLLCDNKNY